MSSSLEMELMQLAFGDGKTASAELIDQVGRHYEAGETLFKEGDRGHELFLLLRGQVEVYTGVESLAVISGGEILGEMSHFDEQPRSASARARTPVDALCLDRDNFGLIFQLHPKWTIQLVEGLAQRIERTREILAVRSSIPPRPQS